MQSNQQQWNADKDIYGAQAGVSGARLGTIGRQGDRAMEWLTQSIWSHSANYFGNFASCW